MRSALITVCLLALPFLAHAQEVAPAAAPEPASHAASPMLVVTPKTIAETPPTTGPNFPDWAVTKLGENTSGQKLDIPQAPANPANPPAPANASSPANPNAPTPPPAPVNPVSKLWPRDTVPIFLTSCANFHVELVKPCTCVITKLMLVMPHDEFLLKSQNGTIEDDPRVRSTRAECVTTPQRRD